MFWKIVWQVLRKLNIVLAYSPANALLGIGKMNGKTNCSTSTPWSIIQKYKEMSYEAMKRHKGKVPSTLNMHLRLMHIAK